MVMWSFIIELILLGDQINIHKKRLENKNHEIDVHKKLYFTGTGKMLSSDPTHPPGRYDP